MSPSFPSSAWERTSANFRLVGSPKGTKQFCEEGVFPSGAWEQVAKSAAKTFRRRATPNLLLMDVVFMAPPQDVAAVPVARYNSSRGRGPQFKQPIVVDLSVFQDAITRSPS